MKIINVNHKNIVKTKTYKNKNIRTIVQLMTKMTCFDAGGGELSLSS